MKKFNYQKDKALLSAVAIFLSLYYAFSFTLFASACGNLRSEVVRLHILANSDSRSDQQLKLKVRDALLRKNTMLLSDSVTRENAEEYFEMSNDVLLREAERVVRENGFTYKVTISLEEEYFETRQYGELTFPAGEYLSLKVIIGEGKGKNWWCVMFPPLCVGVAEDVTNDKDKTAEYLSPNEREIISDGKYIFKFKIVEAYEQLKHFFS